MAESIAPPPKVTFLRWCLRTRLNLSGPIAWAYMGYRGTRNKKRDLRTPDDLKGLKIRVLQNPMNVDTMNAMGGMGVAMGSGEIYSALQQGVIDGIYTSPQLLDSMKIYEVAKFYAPLQVPMARGVVGMNLEVWNRLSPEHQKIFMEAAKTWQKIHEDYYLDPSKSTSDMSIINTFKERGVKVSDLDREAFQKTTIPVVRKYREKIGPQLFDKAAKFVGYDLK